MRSFACCSRRVLHWRHESAPRAGKHWRHERVPRAGKHWRHELAPRGGEHGRHGWAPRAEWWRHGWAPCGASSTWFTARSHGKSYWHVISSTVPSSLCIAEWTQRQLAPAHRMTTLPSIDRVMWRHARHQLLLASNLSRTDHAMTKSFFFIGKLSDGLKSPSLSLLASKKPRNLKSHTKGTIFEEIAKQKIIWIQQNKTLIIFTNFHQLYLKTPRKLLNKNIFYRFW